MASLHFWDNSFLFVVLLLNFPICVSLPVQVACLSNTFGLEMWSLYSGVFLGVMGCCHSNYPIDLRVGFTGGFSLAFQTVVDSSFSSNSRADLIPLLLVFKLEKGLTFKEVRPTPVSSVCKKQKQESTQKESPCQDNGRCFAGPVREALLYSCPSLIFPDLLGDSQGALVASSPSVFGSISFQVSLLFWMLMLDSKARFIRSGESKTASDSHTFMCLSLCLLAVSGSTCNHFPGAIAGQGKELSKQGRGGRPA